MGDRKSPPGHLSPYLPIISVQATSPGRQALFAASLAATMSPETLELYVFVHYNWQYEFMRPSIAEIVEAYLKIYGGAHGGSGERVRQRR